MKHIILLEGTVRFILPSLQETGRVDEDLNLPIGDHRKSHTALPTITKTPIDKRRIRFTLRVEPI